MLEKPSDLSPLTDPNFVQRAMTHLQNRPARDETLKPGRSEKPWPGLGKRVEVLRIPTGVDEVAAGVSKMGIS